MAAGKGIVDIALPSDFVDRMHVRYGDAWTSALCSALSSDAGTSIQLNPQKAHDLFVDEESVPWCPHGRYLKERPVFTLDPLYHAGVYYSQEASSMFLWHMLQSLPLPQHQPLRMLDLCASPGGKSLIMSHFLGHRGVLVSNEINKQRNAILVENLIKSGVQNTVVSSAQASDWGEHEGVFDVILIDAPCSGEGMFRKDPQARAEWSLANVDRCAIRQREIIEQVLPALRPGGFLIYSTCTFDSSENEEVLQEVIQRHGFLLHTPEVDAAWGISPGDGQPSLGFRFWPHRIRGEGFFMGALRAPDNGESQPHRNLRPKVLFSELERKLRPVVAAWLDTDGVFMDGRGVCYRSVLPLVELNAWAHNVYFTMPGAPLGEIKHHDFIPHAALALAVDVPLQVPRIELNENEALAFLRGEAWACEPGQGWALVQYRGVGLGWIKRMGNRINNYCPKEWRIRMR